VFSVTLRRGASVAVEVGSAVAVDVAVGVRLAGGGVLVAGCSVEGAGLAGRSERPGLHEPTRNATAARPAIIRPCLRSKVISEPVASGTRDSYHTR
jgi:hypothetical protein